MNRLSSTTMYSSIANTSPAVIEVAGKGYLTAFRRAVIMPFGRRVLATKIHNRILDSISTTPFLKDAEFWCNRQPRSSIA